MICSWQRSADRLIRNLTPGPAAARIRSHGRETAPYNTSDSYNTSRKVGLASSFNGTILRLQNSGTRVRACRGVDQKKPLTINAEIGGQYEDTFDDVEKQMLDYFTYKAVQTVLVQLLEMNPGQYQFLYNYVVKNRVTDSKTFIRNLVEAKQELGERVMITRLSLFSKWVKKYDHSKLEQSIKDENLELLRERLIKTVKFHPDEGQSETEPASST